MLLGVKATYKLSTGGSPAKNTRFPVRTMGITSAENTRAFDAACKVDQFTDTHIPLTEYILHISIPSMEWDVEYYR